MSRRQSMPHRATAAAGFTLIEVLVSVLLVAVGLLGVSKMQAASTSNTQLARSRALVAFQASSLAALMHGNKAYWGANPVDLTMKPGTLSGTGASALTSTKNCTTASTICTPLELATFDVNNWVARMATHFPSYTATVSCTQAVSLEVECLLSISWAEKYVAVSKTTASAAGAVQSATQLYTQVVRP